MNRYKLSAVLFLIVLSLLSLTQIMIDMETGRISGEGDKAGDLDPLNSKKTYSIFIEIEDKTLYLLEGNTCIKEYIIASGKSGYPSPLGSWRIIEKGDWGEGFGGSWLGLDVPWGIYGIHGTLFNDTIGSAVSKGCIRMFSEDVGELSRLVQPGTRVTIANGQFGPFGRGFDEINPGDRGADVLAVQMRLRKLGYYMGRIDGIYEDDLKRALHKFQRGNKLIAQNTITKEAWLVMGFMEFE